MWTLASLSALAPPPPPPQTCNPTGAAGLQVSLGISGGTLLPLSGQLLIFCMYAECPHAH